MFSPVNIKCHRIHFVKFLAVLSTISYQFEKIKSVLDMCSYIMSNSQDYIILLNETGTWAMGMNQLQIMNCFLAPKMAQLNKQ